MSLSSWKFESSHGHMQSGFQAGFFCLYTMRVVYLHTNPYFQEIEDLILDIKTNFKSDDFQLFDIQYADFKWHRLSIVKKIRDFLKDNKIDIIHTYYYIDAFYALLASKFLKVKVVYSCYSYHDNLRGISKMTFKHVVNNVDSIIFQTDVQKNVFLSKFKLDPDKHFKLFHGFSMKRLDADISKSLRDEFFIDDFRYIIGTYGDFAPEHDLMSIFKMVRKLRKSGRNFTCLVAGEMLDEYESYFNDCKYYYLVHGLDNYITFVGRRENTADFMRQLDAFVYHSDNEAVALPVIRAMISGVSVIVNDDEMIREITCNGKYATLYKSDDVTGFANNTRQILSDLEDYQLIAETVQEECRNIYSIKKHILGLKEIYKKVNNF